MKKNGSREKILASLRQAQSGKRHLPPLHQNIGMLGDVAQKFYDMATAVGASVVNLETLSDLKERIGGLFPSAGRIVSMIPDSPWFGVPNVDDARAFEDVDLAILKGHFAVAENGAVWVTDRLMGDRVIPFISQHLVLVVQKNDLVPSMLEAYERIGNDKYEFGIFIAGPSKTADIEQSLVFGAHGPKSLSILLIG